MPVNELEVEVAWLDEVDSTSRLARDYLAHHPKSIRAFAAKKQTAGAGRQGRPWQSVEGNLHISLAFPGSLVPQNVRDILPIVAGVAVAKLIERSAGIRPVLKWPNDIVLNGCKIGGILCEATITGGNWNGVVIGVGLNLLQGPQLNDDADYQSSSILQLTGKKLTPHLVGEALARQLIDSMCQMNREQTLSEYRSFSTMPGQIWQSRNSHKYWVQDEFDDSGNLRVKGLDFDESRTLASAEHEFLWGGQSSKSFWVADIGNTRVKVGLVVHSETGLTVTKQMAWQPGHDKTALADFVKDQPVIYASSVNEKHFELFKHALPTTHVTKLHKRPLRSFSSKYQLSAMGMDRFVSVEAALALRFEGKISGPLVIVSCGTATTIDFIDEAGIHQGGLIGAGVDLGLNALHSGTGALPEVKSIQAQQWNQIPHETTAAMASAALRSQAAWIEREASEWCKTLHADMQHGHLLISGGHADQVIPLLSESCQKMLYREPNLNLLGIALLALNGA